MYAKPGRKVYMVDVCTVYIVDVCKVYIVDVCKVYRVDVKSASTNIENAYRFSANNDHFVV